MAKGKNCVSPKIAVGTKGSAQTPKQSQKLEEEKKSCSKLKIIKDNAQK